MRVTTPIRSSRSRWAWHRDDGAVLAETAIVTPVFLLLMFAVLEFGVFFKDELTVTNAVRSGARAGIAPVAEGFADWDILQIVARESAALDRDIDRIVVYDAEATGTGDIFSRPVPPTCLGATGVTGLCNVYDASDLLISKSTFENASYTKRTYWDGQSDRSYSREAGTSYLGVYIEYEYVSVLGLILDGTTISDSFVMRIEPRTR